MKEKITKKTQTLALVLILLTAVFGIVSELQLKTLDFFYISVFAFVSLAVLIIFSVVHTGTSERTSILAAAVLLIVALLPQGYGLNFGVHIIGVGYVLSGILAVFSLGTVSTEATPSRINTYIAAGAVIILIILIQWLSVRSIIESSTLERIVFVYSLIPITSYIINGAWSLAIRLHQQEINS